MGSHPSWVSGEALPGEVLSVISRGPLWSPGDRWRGAWVSGPQGPDLASIEYFDLYLFQISLTQKNLFRESILQIDLKTRYFFRAVKKKIDW